jgi:hypothetical protein
VWGLPQDMPKHEGQQACKQIVQSSLSQIRKPLDPCTEIRT